MNLAGCDFRNSDLRKANLTGAKLQRANFYETSLGGARSSIASTRPRPTSPKPSLEGAHAHEGNFTGAVFRYAKLVAERFHRLETGRADLSVCDVRCNLSRTDLYEADLRGSKLAGANLTQGRPEPGQLRRCQPDGGGSVRRQVPARTVPQRPRHRLRRPGRELAKGQAPLVAVLGLGARPAGCYAQPDRRP